MSAWGILLLFEARLHFREDVPLQRWGMHLQEPGAPIQSMRPPRQERLFAFTQTAKRRVDGVGLEYVLVVCGKRQKRVHDARKFLLLARKRFKLLGDGLDHGACRAGGHQTKQRGQLLGAFGQRAWSVTLVLLL